MGSQRYGPRKCSCESRANRQEPTEIQSFTNETSAVAGVALHATTAVTVDAATAGVSQEESSRWIALDANRFDDLLRGWQTGSRRGAVSGLAAVTVGAMASLLGLSDSDAKKKKKKRKIWSPPSDSAPPPEPSLGPPPTWSPPPPPTVPPPPPPPTCQGACGPAGTTCTQDCQCCGELSCRFGVCGCPRGFDCGDQCCNTGTETCVESTDVCLNTMCPVDTDYCTDPETYACSDGCVCVTSVNGQTVCTELPRTCTPCATDNDCAGRGVCVRNGRWCGNICSSTVTGFCVSNVCLDLPSGLAPNTPAVAAEEPGPETSASSPSKRRRSARGKSHRVAKKRTKKHTRLSSSEAAFVDSGCI